MGMSDIITGKSFDPFLESSQDNQNHQKNQQNKPAPSHNTFDCSFCCVFLFVFIARFWLEEGISSFLKQLCKRTVFVKNG